MRIKTTVTETLAFSDVAMEFINFKAAEQVAPRTLNDYIKTFKKFSDFGCNTMELEILNNDLVEFFKSIPDTSPAVYNRPFSNLSSFFNWCVKQDILECNPLSKLGLHKKRDDGNIHSASIDDIKALLDTCDRKTFTGLRNYTMILLMLDTGIRTSEITRLVNSDYDSAARTIIVTKDKAKTRRERICYLSDNVISALSCLERIYTGWPRKIRKRFVLTRGIRMKDYSAFYTARDTVSEILRKDFIGPVSKDETLTELPLQYYLMGKLYPKEDVSEELDMARNPFLENAAESYDSSISLSNQKNPSSMGITFTLMPSVTRFVVKGSYHCIIQGVAVKVIKDG